MSTTDPDPLADELRRDILAKAREVDAAYGAGPDPDHLCQQCGASYCCDDGMEPTVLCHPCAQEAANLVPALLARLAPAGGPTPEAAKWPDRVWRSEAGNVYPTTAPGLAAIAQGESADGMRADGYAPAERTMHGQWWQRAASGGPTPEAGAADDSLLSADQLDELERRLTEMGRHFSRSPEYAAAWAALTTGAVTALPSLIAVARAALASAPPPSAWTPVGDGPGGVPADRESVLAQVAEGHYVVAWWNADGRVWDIEDREYVREYVVRWQRIQPPPAPAAEPERSET